MTGEGCWYNRKDSADMEEKVVTIINEMAEYLNVSQMKKLQEVLLKTFSEQKASKTEIYIKTNYYYKKHKSLILCNGENRRNARWQILNF